jgi:hypothetical protein
MNTKKHDDDERDEHDKAKVPVTKTERRSDEEMERMRREDPAFLEKTRPEDPSGRPGQATRDNVNPNIPSGKPGDPPGPIVDPNSLGMPQGGVAPAHSMQPETPDPTKAAPKLPNDKKRGKDDDK